MESIEQLIQPHPAEGEVEAAEARGEYETALAFAGLQLRARALRDEAWTNYQNQAHLETVVREIVERHTRHFNLETLAALSKEARQLGTETTTRFALWSDLSRFASANGREDLTSEQAGRGLAAVACMEQEHADELLKQQGRQCESRANRAEIEKEVNA